VTYPVERPRFHRSETPGRWLAPGSLQRRAWVALRDRVQRTAISCWVGRA